MALGSLLQSTSGNALFGTIINAANCASSNGEAAGRDTWQKNKKRDRRRRALPALMTFLRAV
jgi:hypothetical protein